MTKLTAKEIKTICLLARRKNLNGEQLNKIVKEKITYKAIIEKLFDL